MAEKDEEVPATEQPTPPVVTGADLESALRGATFPATTRELLERARQNGAEDYVVERLAGLADRRATSLGDVLRHLDMLS